MKRKKRKYLKNKKRKSALDYVRLPKAPNIDLGLSSDTKKSIFIILIGLFGIISLLSLFGLAGTLGVYLSKMFVLGFGWGKWVMPLLLLFTAFIMYNEDKYIIKGASYVGLILFFISFESLLHYLVDVKMWEDAIELGRGGGYTGFFLASSFVKIIGFWGGLIALVCLLLVSLMLILNKSLRSLVGSESVFARILSPVIGLISRIFKRGERYEDEEDLEEEFDEEDLDEEDEEEIEDEDLGFEKKEISEADEKEEVDTKVVAPKKSKPLKIENHWEQSNIKIDLPVDLLSGKIGKPTSGDIKNNSLIIQRTLENFGIAVEMNEVSVGPTVTQYTFRPSEGIKLSRITTLSNDLALALAAHPIRIEAPIPGKALVGIEVPNQSTAIVGLRETLSSPDFVKRDNNLMLALGKDVSGKSWSYELSKMPHLLVAGATNSGKSVCLNSIIVSLLYQNNPDDLRFIMVDPKRVELPVYNGIPHLLTPVITDVSKTINALKWCLNEMDRRFELLSKSGKRNIQAYNKSGKEKMPYIVFIIDELADLMVVAAKDVETGIIRLAQMARAVGIHLVLATQRPSVDVITGLIKANMPARIAFSVASGVDSKTILDSLGAEKLLGKGDMLLMTADLSKPKRIQGAYLSDLEIKRVVHYIKENTGEFEYLEGITDKQKVAGMGGVGLDGAGSGDEDDLFEEAKEIVINMDKASASLLQRRLSIGYARAARIMDMLEEYGIIGGANGSKPREILISKDQYEASMDMGTSGMPVHSREESEAPESYLDDEEHDVPPVFASSKKNESSDSDDDEDDEDIEDDDENMAEEAEQEQEDSKDQKEEDRGFDKFFSK